MLTKLGNISHIFFDLVIFFLLVIFVFRLIKLYLIPAFYKEIEKDKEEKKIIEEKNNFFEKEEKKITLQIDDQAKSFAVIDQKIKLWNLRSLEEKEQSEKENSSYMIQIEEKRKRQAENLALLKLEMAVLPTSMERAYESIKKSYGGEKGLELLRELINKVDVNK